MKAQTLLLAVIIVAFLAPQSSTAQFKEYSGSGDDILLVEKPDSDLPALLVIRGNSSSGFFSVSSYDENQEQIDLLVNTTNPYSGIVPVDLPVGTNTKMLEITATGSWVVNVYSIGSAPKVSSGSPKSDEGDNLLWIEGEASLASISGNSASSHFAVEAFDGNGNYSKLLVNTTDPYSGKVMLPKGTLLLKISAVGSWSVSLQ